MAIFDASITRRSLLAGTGGLIASFSMAATQAQEAGQKELPGSLADDGYLDSWVRIGDDNTITIFTGKAELGQGISTALLQIAAEELEVEPSDITLITADTARTPDEGYTAGSQSMANSGTAIRSAAAQVRALLYAEAAKRLSVTAPDLRAEGKRLIATNGRSANYGELVAGQMMHVDAKPDAELKQPATFRVMGKSLERIDIPAKVTGHVAYVQDLRLENMLHARVVRPPSYAAELIEIDTASVEKMAGVVSVIRDSRFLAAVAEEEFQAISGMRMLAAAAKWRETATLPDQAKLPGEIRALERQVGTVAEAGNPVFAGNVYEATFTRPYTIHGSIGPSCAVAQMKPDGTLEIWSHTQGVYPDREAIAEMLAMPLDKVRIIHMEGSGCYGHNGADDAAADAALIARKLTGRPIRVQWMREQEHSWEPFGPAMVMKVRAGLSADGKIADWSYDLWSNTHTTRPGGAGSVIAGRHMAKSYPPEVAELRISPPGNGDRNADPAYSIPNKRILWHFLPDMPLRVSALRSLGAYANVFAIESSVDELARMANSDPVEFRLKQLEDVRARDVIRLAAERFGWNSWRPQRNRGRGFAYARYKNLAAYLALAIEAAVEPETGRVQIIRVIAAIDSGEIVNPDGIRNQTEGGILQSLSWTLFESVSFDRTRISSIDWSSYPIMRFPSVPEKVEVHIIDRPGEPFLGTGEAAQGPTSAAVANAIRDAIGKRLFELPLSRDRIREEMLG
jgi:nicotinate dehydrogenase subunit B